MSNYSDSSFSRDPNSSWYKIYKHIKPSSLVLDIGCSSGTFGKILQDEKKCIVDGIEPDEEDNKKAKKLLRKALLLNIETDNLSSIKDRYDYIYFGDVIEHLITPIPTLKRVEKLLKPDGEILFSIPNMAHLSVRMMLLKGGFVYGETGLLDKTHFHFYTFDEIQRVFNEAGYEISYLSPVVKDYPEKVIKEELAEVGLKSSKKFINFTRSTQASIYQYVGAAKPTQEPYKRKLDKVSPVDRFQKYLNNTEKYYKKRILLLEEQLEAYKKHTTGLEEQYQAVNNALLEKSNKKRPLDKIYAYKKKVGLLMKKTNKNK